jgi:hypothetical protein
MTAVAGAPAVVRRSRPGVRARRLVWAVVALAVAVGVLMAATGWGTGDGPLGPPGGAKVGITANVGDAFTEGGIFLHNDGPFDAHIESVRAVPAQGATEAMPVVAVTLTTREPGRDAIGIVEGSGEELVPTADRHPAEGFVIHPDRAVGRDLGMAEVLVTYRVEREGTWHYSGYEVTYRSGLVRHRMLVPLTVEACAPKRATPDCHEGPS